MAMGITERLRIIFDVETQSFKQGIKSLKADLAAADGMAGKAKVGISAIGTQLKQFGGQALLAGGAIAVGFGVKAIQTVNETTLAVDKLATATGMSLEEASKWKGVGDEVGVALETIQSAAIRMNTAISNGSFTRLGLEAQYAADGTLNVNDTLVRTITTIGAMRSAEERNDAARRVFGRNFAEISRLMELSAADLYAKLESTPDWEITTEEDTKNAKEMQAALDAFGDAAGEVQYLLARGLTPALTDTLEALNAVRDGAKDLGETAEEYLGESTWRGITKAATDELKKWANPLGWFKDKVDETSQAIHQISNGDFGPVRESTEQASSAMSEWDARAQYVNSRLAALEGTTGDLADETDELAGEMVQARSDADQYAASMDGLNQRLVDAKEAIDNLVGEELSKIDAFQRAEDSTRNYTESVESYVLASMDAEASEKDKADALREAARAAVEAARDMATFKDGTYESVEGLATQIQALKDMAAALGPNDPLRAELLAHIGLLEGIQTEVETDVKFDVDDGSVATAQTAKDKLAEPVIVPVTVRVNQEGGVDLDGDAVPDVRSGAGGSVAGGAPNSMQPSGLLQGALDFFAGLVGGRGSGGGGSGSSSKPKASELFAKDMDRLRNMYEVGDLNPKQYLRRLQRLMAQPEYRFRRLSPPWMAWWREVKRAKADAKAAAEAAKKPVDDVDDSAAWEQAAENQAAIEAGRNLSSTAAQSQADLSDDDATNDARALDAWAQAIWRDTEARANRKFKNNRGRGWAQFARKQLQQAIENNPLLASRLRVYLAGIPKFGGGGSDRPDTVAAGAPSVTPSSAGGAGGGGTSRAASGGRDGMTVHVTISAPNAAVVDGKAVRAAIPAIAAELRRFERGQG